MLDFNVEVIDQVPDPLQFFFPLESHDKIGSGVYKGKRVHKTIMEVLELELLSDGTMELEDTEEAYYRQHHTLGDDAAAMVRVAPRS